MLIVATAVIGPISMSSQAGELTAIQAKKLFNDKGCNACHGVDEMRIGPSYTMVAARYAGGNRDTAERLGKKIRYGGAGSWGIVPMISNPDVSPVEAEALARWILGLHKPQP